MQTFLAYSDFELAAKVLDSTRLITQRNDAKMILYINEDKYRETQWDNHPATKMWRGFSRALLDYLRCINDECKHRKLKPGVWGQALLDFGPMMAQTIVKPSWIGIESFHASHRSNLLRMDPIWYGQMGWNETPDFPYYWPV